MNRNDPPDRPSKGPSGSMELDDSLWTSAKLLVIALLGATLAALLVTRYATDGTALALWLSVASATVTLVAMYVYIERSPARRPRIR